MLFVCLCLGLCLCVWSEQFEINDGKSISTAVIPQANERQIVIGVLNYWKLEKIISNKQGFEMFMDYLAKLKNAYI